MDADDLLDQLRNAGVERGDHLALAFADGVGVGLAAAEMRLSLATADPAAAVDRVDAVIGPRWVWWDRSTADRIAAAKLPIDRCWDVLTVHRLLRGGWRTSIPRVWAWLHDLPEDTLPHMGQLGLLDALSDEGDDPEDPQRPDGHLRPEWVSGGWQAGPDRLAGWAALAHRAAEAQLDRLRDRPDPVRAESTAHAESVAELLCAELEVEGLPLDLATATEIISGAVGPRPETWDDEEAARAARDDEVVNLLDPPRQVNLRNPAEVKAMLRRVGLDVPDTRAWRLEKLRDEHAVVAALLQWRKAERIATTYGYRWLDDHVRDGRLVGEWSSTDGAAGRMTASAGLHNMPAEMRPAVAAEPGHVFVRADLGQIEPRVLAAVSGDEAFIAATREDDLYQPVAQRLGVTREVAKLAILGAMYGSTTGESAHALAGLRQAYPVAMGLLEDAAAEGALGHDVLTVGGRRVRMWTDDRVVGDIDRARAAAAARGRFARNALIQGAAAEYFKVWAVIVRRRSRAFDARVVLCLHDELLVHVPTGHADAVAALVADAVSEAAYYWSPSPAVRFVADISIIERWSDAKDEPGAQPSS